jgi:hypothetical protein
MKPEVSTNNTTTSAIAIAGYTNMITICCNMFLLLSRAQLYSALACVALLATFD